LFFRVDETPTKENKMGLDMFAYKTRSQVNAVDFETPPDASEIAYWRKHPNLHGWMEELYYEKGGTQQQFNCTPVRLTADDLDALERAINETGLPHTTGFFFGESRPEEIAIDRAFIADARAAIGDGWFVFYDSWW
jgi:hypothetical protein